jgi:hypothetical protein
MVRSWYEVAAKLLLSATQLVPSYENGYEGGTKFVDEGRSFPGEQEDISSCSTKNHIPLLNKNKFLLVEQEAMSFC